MAKGCGNKPDTKTPPLRTRLHWRSEDRPRPAGRPRGPAAVVGRRKGFPESLRIGLENGDSSTRAAHAPGAIGTSGKPGQGSRGALGSHRTIVDVRLRPSS